MIRRWIVFIAMLIAIISFLLPKKQTDETSIKTAVKKVQQAIYAY